MNEKRYKVLYTKYCVHRLLTYVLPYAISRNQTKITSMFQKHVSSALVWINPNSIISDNSTCSSWNLEFLCCEFQYCCKRCVFRDVNNSKG